MTPEARISAEVREYARRVHNVTLFRNNSGAFKDDSGRLIRFGLANESAAMHKQHRSSDYIGLHAPSGRFVAVEFKAPGWLRPSGDRELAQERFILLIRRLGGLAGFCTSTADFDRIMAG